MSKRKLTIKEHIENFWYYHKWKVVCVIVIAIGVFAFGKYMESSKDNTIYDFKIYSVFARPLVAGEYKIEEHIKDFVEDRDNSGDVKISAKTFYITEDGTGDNDKIMQTQFENTLLQADGDVILFDKSNLDKFIAKDMFAPISDYIDLTKIPEEHIVYRDDVPVAVQLDGSKILNDMKFIIDEVYVSVMFTPDNSPREYARDIVTNLIEKQMQNIKNKQPSP